MQISALYQLFLNSDGITTDTRNIQANQIYFALKGSSFNGNIFALQALENGAGYAIVDEAAYAVNERCILVEDVLETLQQLGLYHKKQIQPKHTIAITGSNGKTTTKELVNAVLATTYKTHYTKGNLNNHIGIPLTLLQMPAGTEIAIIEMGANHQHEIKAYCTYVEPDFGIITNCGKAHLEGFGGEEGIRKGKGELYDYLKSNNGHVFVNGDDKQLLAMLEERSITAFTTYGNSEINNYYATILNENPYLKIRFENTEIDANLFGSYNFTNMMCAITVGKYFGVANPEIKQGIESYTPQNARSQVVEFNGAEIILDAYNANPSSMQHALESFSKPDVINKWVILGDMFELGEYAANEHQFIADLCKQLHFEKIVLVGNEFFRTSVTSSEMIKFPTTLDAKNWFLQQELSGKTILLKGSRGMKMESLLNAI